MDQTKVEHDPDLCKDPDCLDHRCEFRRNDVPCGDCDRDDREESGRDDDAVDGDSHEALIDAEIAADAAQGFWSWW